ncbi:amidase domain-containing protein [Naasia lichenicola]|uniref:CHAP domain-containing protein n=1 Tax=Naasia lichenicola TaxID=2565933 RepID=A0A4S4FGX2_9MICO|nr:amidase domain-containing protein [Naasia lichenicola]THG29371.1 CHAP domain-containing protein [Naasia lichenicola]
MRFRPTSRAPFRATPALAASTIAGLLVVAALTGCAVRDSASETDTAATAAPRSVPTATAAAKEAADAAAPETSASEGTAETDVTSLGTEPLPSAVAAQVSYALAYWSDYNDSFGVVTDNDCVNFTSQSLLQRGWVQDDTWYYDADNVYSSSAAWVSSTAFRDYLETRSDTVALDDSQRDQVAVGDIVQFDWDNSGDRDHTGIVTKVETTDTGVKISFAGHTTDSDYRSVDDAITIDHPGGTAYYFHITS